MSTSRVQLALNVTDLEEATRFYRDFFGVEPAKRRAGYTNFAIADPPLKLVLFENPTATSALNHLGVEAASTDEVAAAAARFAAAGLATRTSSEERCCHAVQDKVWVDAPDVPPAAGSSTPCSPTTPSRPATTTPADAAPTIRQRPPSPAAQRHEPRHRDRTGRRQPEGLAAQRSDPERRGRRFVDCPDTSSARGRNHDQPSD